MSGRDYAFLDLAALPAVGSALLAPRPTLLFSADGRRILFANAAGAAFLGETRMEALLDRQFSPTLPATQQIARAGRSLAPGAGRLERIRFSGSAGFASIAAECVRIALPGGEPAVLVRLPEVRRHGGAKDAAARLAGLLAAEDCLVAVIDAHGAPIADSGDFALLAAGQAAIEELVAAVTASGERLVKRAIRIGDARRPAGLAAFHAEEGLLYLLVIGPEEDIVVESERMPAPVPVERTVPAVSAPLAPPAPAVEAVAAEAAAARPTARPPSGRTRRPPRISPPKIGSVRQEETSTRDGAPAFRFVAPGGPVRFVFQMDAAGRFTFISPEFGQVVGPESGIRVGESWAALAARLRLDGDGAVAGLIARRATWSGVTLAWPVGHDHAGIAVDLAALPAFSRDRQFEGYRGFGVMRPLERSAEPASAEAPTTEAESVAASAPQDVSASNVVRLGRPPGTVDPERLTAPEQDAFRRIAAALASVPAAPPPQSEAAAVSDPRRDHVPPQPAAAEPPPPAPVETAAPAPLVDIASAEPLETPDAPFAGPEPTLPIEDVEDPAPVAPPIVPARRSPPADAGLVADYAATRRRIVELEAILDTATDGVIVVDEDARIERINRSAEALFGVDSVAVAGLRLPDLLAEESRQSALDYLDGLARNGVASVLNDGREVIGRVPQGGLIPLFMTMGRLPETGKFCAVLRDITQWKNAEGELVNARRAAENASMQKSDFLAKVSHEIRTPLNAIIGFSEVMMEERFGPIGTERYKEYLRDIHVSGAHLMSLLNDLLDLSKIEAGKLDLNFESVALNEIVMECVALMQPQANRERIIIRTSLSGQVPNVVADPRSIRQIVLNLVSNAVKFTLAGGQVIVSTAMESHGEVTLRVRDTGIGMSEKDIETALKPFRQVATARERRNDGTGLGLPLTKALVEANRAAFAIDSSVGQGTLIRITFPTTRVLSG